MILVTAAHGNQGKLLVPKLLAAGQPVRACVQSQASAEYLHALGVHEVVVGDVSEPAILAMAIRGAEKVYQVGPTAHPRERAMGFAMVDAAKAEGVRHLVFSSVLHAITTDLVQHEIKRDIEEHLLSSGLEFTILQPANYMLPLKLRPVFEKGVFELSWSLERRQSLVDLGDVTDVACMTLIESERHAGATYELAAPGRYTAHDLGDIISRVLGRPIKVLQIDADTYLKAWVGDADPQQFAHQIGVGAHCRWTEEPAQSSPPFNRPATNRPDAPIMVGVRIIDISARVPEVPAMTTAPTTAPAQGTKEIQDAGHVDVLIVGAGVSGIGAAHHLRDQFPDRTFVILDAQDNRGGTWWTHRYPGVRSDSDLFTYGYRFKPWRGPSIAAGEEILAYLDEVIDEYDLDQYIRYRHRATAAGWSTEDRRWTVEVTRGDTGQHLRFSTGFLWMCQGYYNHTKPYRPQWEGMGRFQGVVVHPQRWPEDLDLAGKRVVVVGSGATAATLIPAIAEKAKHVTMLQRSPSYFYAPPTTHELAVTLRALDIPEEWTHEILRRQYISQYDWLARTSLEAPDELHTFLIESMRPLLPGGLDIDKHFTPRYRPWQQRIAVVPDGDLFAVLREGKTSIVTDTIETFTEHGITVSSGEEIPADIVVTATGFNLSVLGDVAFTVDGKPVDFTERVTWRGIMINGLPNMAYVFGYFRHSWTLRVDLVSDLVGRLLANMQDKGATMVVPTLRTQDTDMQLRPWSDPENFNPGYVTRSQHILFKQGDREPWTHMLEHEQEREILPEADLDDGTLVYR